MATRQSRYRPETPPDYRHRYHAGNVGDVWKHAALMEVLRRAASRRSVVYVESHAGEGVYPLAPTGEWTEGIGRLWDAAATVPGSDDLVGRYVSTCRRLGAGTTRPERYPGSPLLARAVLGAEARLVLFERDPTACAGLAAVLGGDAAAVVTCGDGLAALPTALRDAEADADAVVALIDPPFTQKPDWIAVPDALIAAAGATPHATLVLWYPIKSLTRPNAMIARLKAAGVAATIAELVTTPLEHQRQRLNGSGLVLIRPPAGAVEAAAAAAPVLGRRCATREGAWSLRLTAW